MKGIVFNLLEHYICQEHGDAAWDSIVQSAGVEGAYTSLGSYPDEEMMKLVSTAAALLRVQEETVIRRFGRTAARRLAARYPVFFEPHRSTRAFLLTLNDIIHPEVRVLYPGADVPDFEFDTSSEDVLTMSYASKRRLCAFAIGLMEGAADYYGEEISIEHTACMKRGDERCVFKVSSSSASQRE